MLIATLMFIFSKIFSYIFFGLIWSQNLKFFKLTEIWYRDSLPYTCFDFIVFFQNFCHSYFLWENSVPQNQKFAKLNEIWSRVTQYMLILTLTFTFSNFFPFIFMYFFHSYIEVLQIDKKLVHRQITICLFPFHCLFFHFFCHSYLFRQIQSQKFFKLTEMLYFDIYFFKILIIHIFGLIWSHKLKFSILLSCCITICLI